MTIQDLTGISGSPERDQGSTKEANGVKEDDETTVRDVNGLPVLKADGTRQKMKRKKSRRGLAGRKGDAPGLISSRDLLVNEGAPASRPTQTPNRTTSNDLSRKNSIMRKKSSVLETSDDPFAIREGKTLLWRNINMTLVRITACSLPRGKLKQTLPFANNLTSKLISFCPTS